jgi:WD40 repeat protein/serine/threonine protein kinase
MTPDELAHMDDAFFAELLAVDAALAAGEDPRQKGNIETLNTIESDTISGYIQVLQRLGYRGMIAAPKGEAVSQAMTSVRLGRFEIQGTLGQGGFGIVHLAFDPVLGRKVALKVPRPEVVMSPDVRRRFLREARAAAGLDHPNLVPVFDAGEAGPLCYIASAYCPGFTLSAWLKARTEPVPPELAARLIAALGDAVQHAHDRGILHRDIKPSNVILSSHATNPEAPHGDRGMRAGTLPPDPPPPSHNGSRDENLSPRLTDFGLARIAEDADEETRTGVPLGSPSYMAPEQAAGRNRDVGPATDIYALGATLFEILTGRPPFRGETVTETLRMVIEEDCVAPRVLRPGIPRDLETICLKCLMKDPSRRYATARALSEDLRRYLEHKPVQARPISASQRISKWVQRRPVHAATLVLAILICVGLLAGLIHRNDLVQRHAQELEREVVRADASERLALRHLKAFQLRQSRDALDANQLERAQDILRDIQVDGEGVSTDPRHLGFAWNYLKSQACRNVVVLSDRRSERISEVALSPDGQTLATGDEDGTIRLRDPETGRVLNNLSGHKFSILRLIFAPTGRRLASVGRNGSAPQSELCLWDIPSGNLVARLEDPTSRAIADVRFDPSANFLWEIARFEDEKPKIRLWNVAADPERRGLLWTRTIRSESPPLSHDGRYVALEEPEPRFVVRDVQGKELGRTGVVDLAHSFAALSPDGKFVAVAGASRTVILWDLVKGQERTRFIHSEAKTGRVCFSPDGRYLGCSFRSGAFVIHDLVSRTSHEVSPGIADPDLNSRICFSPDSRLFSRNVPSVAGRAQPTQIWQLSPWQQIARYPGIPQASETHAWHSSGKSHFTSLGYEAIRWDFTVPREQAQPAGHADEAWSLAFSPDSRMLASGSDDTDEPHTIKLWDVASGRQIRGWNAGVGTVSTLAFRPNGQLLASGHLGSPGEVRLWDPGSGQLLDTLSGHTDSVRTLAFSPDGATLVTAGSDFSVRLWDVQTGRCLHVLNGHTDTVRYVSFSPDGTRLATAGNDKIVNIWDFSSGRISARIPWLEKIAGVCYSPDGERLATADEHGLITLWDATTSSRVQTISSDEHELRCLVFSPDGEALATAGKGNNIQLWDPGTAQELLTLEGHKAQMNSLAFSPDGSTLASCSHDGMVRLWRSVPRKD